MSSRRSRILPIALFLGAALPAAAAAEGVEDFYKKNDVTVFVGFGPGSGYDLWARVVARHWGRHIPGNPTIVVKNMPGAGSTAAANHIYNVAPKDGSVIGMLSRTVPSRTLLDVKTARFEPRKFGWVGSPTVPSNVCGVLTDTGVKTVDDLRRTEVNVGGTGAQSDPSFMPRVLNELVGTKFKVVEGYRSSEEVHLAMARGEVSGICQSHSSLSQLGAELIKTGKLRILFNIESKPNPELKGAPSVFDYLKDAENRQILSFITSSTELGRPLVAPPGLPTERLAALRKGFDATMKDAAFLDDAKRLEEGVSPITGAELEKLVNDLFDTPRPIVEKAGALMTSIESKM